MDLSFLLLMFTFILSLPPSKAESTSLTFRKVVEHLNEDGELPRGLPTDMETQLQGGPPFQDIQLQQNYLTREPEKKALRILPMIPGIILGMFIQEGFNGLKKKLKFFVLT